MQWRKSWQNWPDFSAVGRTCCFFCSFKYQEHYHKKNYNTYNHNAVAFKLLWQDILLYFLFSKWTFLLHTELSALKEVHVLFWVFLKMESALPVNLSPLRLKSTCSHECIVPWEEIKAFHFILCAFMWFFCGSSMWYVCIVCTARFAVWSKYSVSCNTWKLPESHDIM